MHVKTYGAAETPSYGTERIRIEAASARAKRSSVGGEMKRAFADVYRMGGRARVYADLGEGHFSFDLERDEAIAFARALLAKVGYTLEA